MMMASSLSIKRSMHLVKILEISPSFFECGINHSRGVRLQSCVSIRHQNGSVHHLPYSSSLRLNNNDLAGPTLSSRPHFHVRYFYSSVPRLDHYRVLGVRRNATQKEIKDAFYQLSLVFHPDRQPKKTTLHHGKQMFWQPDPSLEEYQRISVAYSVLRDPEKRLAYDRRRSASLTSFDKWRDDLEEWRHRRYHRNRFARQEGAAEGEEEERKRRTDHHGVELMMGARKNSNRLLFLVGGVLIYMFYENFIHGRLFR